MQILGILLAVLLSMNTMAQTVTEECHVDGLSTLVECGELTVPLDYDDPSGNQITLGFTRLASFSESSTRNPVFFLAGGPGESATSLTARVNDMLSDTRSDRDIVLIDQRGTGKSAPFECEPPDEVSLASRYDLVDLDLLADCVESLPAGVEHFTTANAIRDFERVREHLGYQRVDLYGGSYGSRAALAYLGIAGESVDHVILDGIAPPSVPIGLFGESAAAAFERTLARCAHIESCAAAFPNLRRDFETVDARLREGPIEAQLPHPTTGRLTDVRIWHGQFISLLRLTLYSPQSSSLLPVIVSEAAQGNYLPLLALGSGAGSSSSINVLMNLVIVCNEDFPRFTEVAIREDADNSFGREASYKLWREACPLIPSFVAEREWMEAEGFSQPALLLSGAADPVTPPSNGEIALQLFDNATHVVAPESAHIVASSECGGQLVADFLNDPAAALDTDCLNEAPVQRYRLDTMGSLSVADDLINPSTSNPSTSAPSEAINP